MNIDNLKELPDIKEFLPYLKSIGTFLSIMKFIPKGINHIKEKMSVHEYDINEIFDEINKDKLSINDYISTEGYLLKYGQVFKPYTYTNSVWGPTTKEEIRDIENKNHITKDKSREDFYFTRQRMYLPIQTLNHFDNIGCAFLYDYKFSGFIMGKDLSKGVTSELSIEIDKYAKPILVLYDISKHSKFLNNKVNIKGKVVIIPNSIAASLNGIYDDNIRAICSNFYRPYNENINMICISLLDDKTNIHLARKSSLCDNFLKLEMPIFLEAKLSNFSNINNDSTIEMLNKIIPNTIDKKLKGAINNPYTLRDENDPVVSFPSFDENHFTYNSPDRVGFYTTTSLLDNEMYIKSLENLTRIVNNFSIDYKNLSKKNFGKEDKLSICFLYDYTKMNIFDPHNINFEFDKLTKFNSNDPTIDTLTWLNQK